VHVGPRRRRGRRRQAMSQGGGRPERPIRYLCDRLPGGQGQTVCRHGRFDLLFRQANANRRNRTRPAKGGGAMTVTLAQVRKAARARYGKRADVTVNNRAPSAASRQSALEKRRALQARLNELRRATSMPAGAAMKLLRAVAKSARFVVDTDGD